MNNLSRRSALSILGKGLAAIVCGSMGGCERVDNGRTGEIEKLQSDARSFVNYVEGKGYEYAVKINEGRVVEVNLSDKFFDAEGNLMAYSYLDNEDNGRNVFVRVYRGDEIKVWVGGKRDYSAKRMRKEQHNTDEALEAVSAENGRVKKEFAEQITREILNR